jgi:cell division protein FtsA
MPESPIIVGLEIGTSKVCAMVGQLSPEGALSIVGLGQAKSRSVRKGEIINPDSASEDIRNALAEAEAMADVEIRSVFLGVTGGHVRGFTNRGMHPVVSADREITDDDVADAIKNAKAINLPADNCLVHAIRQHFRVDGQEGITNPVGMLGARLEVDVHVIHGHFNRLQNPIRIVKGLHIEVEAICFNGLASALAALNPDQKQMGTLVIDIGGGTTEFVVYRDGVIRHSGVIAVGGDHVSNDLAHGLKVPLGRAEMLKIEHGAAFVEESDKGQLVPVQNHVGAVEKAVSKENLRRIMHERLDELLQLVRTEVYEAGLLDYLNGGVVLCGGSARIPGLDRLAAQIFQTRASLATVQAVAGLPAALDQPEFMTAIGLVKFGSFQYMRRPRTRVFSVATLKKNFTQLFSRR